MKTAIYLDNSLIARPSDKTLQAMLPFFTDKWGTASAPHQKGQELYPALKDSLQALYTLVGASHDDTVLFTSSGAEAINHVIHTVYHEITLSTGKNQFITTSVEEAPLSLATARLERQHCVIKNVKPNKTGVITADAIADMISPRTALVSLSWGNGLTGIIQPIADIAALCRHRGILFHVDATHTLGKVFFDLNDIGIDFLTFNGDQLHAPKGTGGLYIRTGAPCSPFIVGGSEQGGLRAGSVNMPALVALGSAAQECVDGIDFLCTEVARLRDQLEQTIESAIPGAHCCFRDQERLPHCTTILFPGVSNEALLYLLNRKGVYANIGGGTFQQLGLLLSACGFDQTDAYSAVSFSLSRHTTEEEVERAATIIIESVHHLRQLSNQWTHEPI